MARIRYIGEQLIARAFEHTFHHDHWDEQHGLNPRQIDILANNPQFEVAGVANSDGSDAPTATNGAPSDTGQ